MQEVDNIKKRYAKRKQATPDDKYSYFNPAFLMEKHDREKKLIEQLKNQVPVENKKIIEIGCGRGEKILQLIKLGFNPDNIIANELLEDSLADARKKLPSSITIMHGDASTLNIASESIDIVYQSTVFSSILDNDFQEKLANKMWQWVKPGGGVLWYDFTFDNPKNKDVSGVTVNRIKQLFPDGEIKVQRVTLAPPISRLVCKIHPSLYTFFNTIPFLRSHVFCWIEKKSSQ